MNEPQTAARERAGHREPSLPLGILGGLAGAIAGAGLWALVMRYLAIESSAFMIAMGAIVGIATRIAGRGSTAGFGVAGTILTLLGIASGIVAGTAAVLAFRMQASAIDIISDRHFMPAIFELWKSTFSAVDIVFLMIALYEGFSLARGGATRFFAERGERADASVAPATAGSASIDASRDINIRAPSPDDPNAGEPEFGEPVEGKASGERPY